MASNQNDTKERKLEYFYQLNSVMPLMRIVSASILIIMGILILDILNIPSRLFEKAPEQLRSVVLVGFVLIIAFWLIEHSYIQAYRLKTINSIDTILSCLFLSSLICSFYYSVSAGGYSIKACITLVSLLFSFISIIYRANKCKYQTKHNEYILDFNDIVNNNFTVSKDFPLLISEKEVDYDLLNRSSIIEQLYSTITNYQSDRSFVIALCGEWGIGKTTIINNTKKLLKKDANSPVIIEDFDPWIYGSRDALLLSMFEKILNKAGVKYSVLKSHRIAKSLKITFGDIGKALSNTDQVSSLIQELVSPNESFDQIAAIKAELSMYLKSLDKPVVFIIDNIDRADSDNVIFLFKLIGTLFDLPNILYILSYDSKRVNELINDTAKINPKYIEKIVQQEIHVPPVPKDHLEALYQICLRNILQQYNVNFESDTIYSSLCKLFADKINVRNYKRLLNSAISRVYQNSHRLDNAALLAIESIKFLSPSLYDLMVNNRKYFISSDKILDDEARDNIYFRDRFNKSGKEFYSDLASEYPQYLSLLCALFPYAYRYNKGEELEL